MPQTPQAAKFDVDAARKAGYSDDEILSHLTQTRKFDVEGALGKGYSKADVIGYLSGTPAEGGGVPGAPFGLPGVPSARSEALKETSRENENVFQPSQRTSLTKMEPSFFGGAPTTEAQSKQISAKAPGIIKEANKLKWEGVGTAVGGEVGGAYKLGRLARAALMGGGTALGSVTGDVTSGEKPDVKGALIKGGVTAATGYTLDLGADLVGRFIKPFITKAPLPATEEMLARQVSSKASELVKIGDAEEGIRASVTAAPKAIREQVIKPAYSGLTGEIDLMPIGETAEAASGKMLAHGTPPSMSRVIKITRAIKAAEGEVMDMLQSGDADAEELQGAARTLMQLEKRAKVPIGDAIQLRSALGRVLATARRAHSPGEAQLVPGEVYQAVKTVKGELDKAIEGAAEAQGKAGHLKMADKLYSTFMNDFYNAGAPLKGVTNLKPGMTGKTVDSLLKPENVNRAVAALKRWGMKDQAAALQKIADMPDRAEAVKGMKDLLTSPVSYTTRTTGALRAEEAARVKTAVEALRKARMDRIKLAGGIVGIGSSIEALRRTIALGKSSRGRHTP